MKVIISIKCKFPLSYLFKNSLHKGINIMKSKDVIKNLRQSDIFFHQKRLEKRKLKFICIVEFDMFRCGR